MKTLTMIAAMLMSAGVAQASDVETVKQALGEQCSVIANYVETTDGGCGDASYGNIKMTVTAGLEGGKTYDIYIDVINMNDEVTEAYSDLGVYYSRDENYIAEGVTYAPGFSGDHQINLEVVNASNGTTVCADQAYVTVR